MSRSMDAMFRRAFEAAYQRFLDEGLDEAEARERAEDEAQTGLDRYADDKLEQKKLGEDRW